MISYKDMTFCTADCANDECIRQLTPEVIEEANKLGLPIAQSDFYEDCDYYRKSS